MIFLNAQEEKHLFVNEELVIKYKKRSDVYLMDIKRELTKQPVYYKIYEYYQKLCNTFYAIIEQLLDGTCETESDLRSISGEFYKACTSFVKQCESIISERAYAFVCERIESLKKVIEQIVYIACTYCFDVEDAE